MIARPCWWEKALSCGSRAIVPSSLTTSASTPAGGRPASLARSTAASVWPGRRRTPPSTARRGNTWPGSGQLVRLGRGVDEDPDRTGPVGRGDPGGDPVPGVDRHGVGRALAVLVHPGHRRQLEPVQVAALHRHADHAAAVADGEREQGRGGLARGEDDVALVLPVLVVDHDDRPAGGDVGDGALDGVQSSVGRVHGQAHDGVLSGVPAVRRAAVPAALEQALNVLRDDVDFEVDRLAGVLVPQRGEPEGGRDQAHGDHCAAVGTVRARRPPSSDTPSMASDPLSTTKRASSAGIATSTSSQCSLRPARHDRPDAVDMSLDDVPAQPGVRAHGPFEVDRAARGQRAQGGGGPG